MDTSVTPNAQLVGLISGVSRQIDILVDARWTEGQETRIIYDAKRRKRKLTVQDVDTFVGLMEDVRARRGVLICTNGWTAAAKKRADETIDLRLLTEEDAEEANHAAMDPCPHCRNSHRKTKGVVFWDGQFPLPLGGWAIVFTGKCDVCRSFAFWCWECGEMTVVPNGVIHTCGCERKWWVETEKNESVFVVGTEDWEVPIDRLPTR